MLYAATAARFASVSVVIFFSKLHMVSAAATPHGTRKKSATVA
jgi:hypothetical protein